MIRTTVASLRSIGLGLAACFAFSSLAVADDCSNWDVSITQPGVDGSIYAITALPNGDLVAGGLFTTIGGIDASSIARFDGASWHSMGDGMNGHVTTLEVLENGELIAAGNFTMAGDVQANHIARWDGATWHALDGGFDSAATALLEMPDGDLIAGGTFASAGDGEASGVARWDGEQWHSLGDGVDGVVHDLALFDDGSGPALHVGGAFATAGGVAVNNIAKWDGASWSAPDEGVDGSVQVLRAFGEGGQAVLYVAGDISAAGYVPLFMGMARWDGAEWSPEGDGMRGDVQAMTVFDDGSGPAMFAAIDDSVSGRSYIARWDGWWWVPVSTPVEGTMTSLASMDHGDGPVLYAAITFASGDKQGSHIRRWQPCSIGSSVVRRVPQDYATIQAAIDAAEDGDSVLIAPGTYHEVIDFLGKTIVIESEAGAQSTIIDGTGLQSSVVTAISGEGIGTTLRGVTITGGVGSQFDHHEVFGGGVSVSNASITIDSCHIAGNGTLETTGGGGLLCHTDSNVLVIDSTLSGNQGRFGGGAIATHNTHSRFVGCTFRQNSGTFGAGLNVNLQASALVSASKFEENIAIASPDGGATGGAMYVMQGAVVERCEFHNNAASGEQSAAGAAVIGSGVIRHTLFSENAADRGGGLWLGTGGPISVYDCQIAGNQASGDGGAVYCHGIHGQQRVIALTDFCGNTSPVIAGSYLNGGGNTFADSCEQVPSDLNGDGVVDVSDLLILLGAWGDCPTAKAASGSAACAADLNRDGAVDVSDLLILLSNWG